MILVEGDSKVSFAIATTLRSRGGRYFIPWIAPLYLIMLSVKQGGIMYHFWYDSIWDWTPVSRTIS